MSKKKKPKQYEMINDNIPHFNENPIFFFLEFIHFQFT